MNEKKFSRGLSLLLIVVSFGFLSSCNLIQQILNPNKDPTVTLAADCYDVYTDQFVTFTATASDPDGDTLSYSWKVNGITVEGTTNEIYRYWLTSSVQYPTISVTVNDGNGGSATASVSITVTPAASIRVGNSSSNSIYFIKYRNNTSPSLSDDLLGSSILPPGYVFTICGFPADYYQVYIQNSNNTSWYVPSDSTFYYIGNGQHFDILVKSNDTITYSTPSSEYPNIVPGKQTSQVYNKEKLQNLLPETTNIIRGPGYTIIKADILDPNETAANRDEAIPLAVRF